MTEKIENESAFEGELQVNRQREKLFNNLEDLTNYIKAFKMPSAQYRIGKDKQGNILYQLIYPSFS
jgi:hypothetical protein